MYRYTVYYNAYLTLKVYLKCPAEHMETTNTKRNHINSLKFIGPSFYSPLMFSSPLASNYCRPTAKFITWIPWCFLPFDISNKALRAGSAGSIFASGSAGPGFDPRRGSNFFIWKFTTSGLGRVEMYTFFSLDCTSQSWIKLQTLPQYVCWEGI